MEYQHSGYPEDSWNRRTPPYSTDDWTLDPDFVYKVALIGDMSVGKTSILRRYVHGDFAENMERTIGVDFSAKTLFDFSKEKIQVWDTSGQERFRTITSGYYRGMHAIILVYDVTKMATFVSLKGWIDDVIKKIPEQPFFSLLGNKVDEDRGLWEVKPKRASKFAMEHGMPFIEVSAKSGTNVDAAFETTVEHMRTRRLMSKSADEHRNNIVVLDEEAQIVAESDQTIYRRCWC